MAYNLQPPGSNCSMNCLEDTLGSGKTDGDLLPNQLLMSGRVALLCRQSGSASNRRMKLYMKVVYRSLVHVCIVYRDADFKFGLGYINLKNCTVRRSDSNDTRFTVQLHTSTQSGLTFEATTKEEGNKWVRAMYPRIITSSPAVSVKKAFVPWTTNSAT